VPHPAVVEQLAPLPAPEEETKEVFDKVLDQLKERKVEEVRPLV